jgi:hypothetical protein
MLRLKKSEILPGGRLKTFCNSIKQTAPYNYYDFVGVCE